MKFIPRHTQIIGRLVVKRPTSTIIIGDPTKVTKFLLVDAVGESAAKSGVKIGDIVIPKALGQLILEGGTRFCPYLEEKDIGFFVRDVSEDELFIQNDAANNYVPFGSPDASKAIGAQDEDVEPKAAAAE